MNQSPILMRPLATKDFPAIAAWLQDASFLATYDYVPPKPLSMLEILSIWMRYLSNEEAVAFALCERESGKLIGWLGYDEWDKENQLATLFIGIGDSGMRGKGYGKAAMHELLCYGFEKMGLFKIQLQVLPFNLAGVALYERCGFVREGTMRQAVLREGIRYDLLNYGLLKKEWENATADNKTTHPILS